MLRTWGIFHFGGWWFSERAVPFCTCAEVWSTREGALVEMNWWTESRCWGEKCMMAVVYHSGISKADVPLCVWIPVTRLWISLSKSRGCSNLEQLSTARHPKPSHLYLQHSLGTAAVGCKALFLRNEVWREMSLLRNYFILFGFSDSAERWTSPFSPTSHSPHEASLTLQSTHSFHVTVSLLSLDWWEICDCSTHHKNGQSKWRRNLESIYRKSVNNHCNPAIQSCAHISLLAVELSESLLLFHLFKN